MDRNSLLCRVAVTRFVETSIWNPKDVRVTHDCGMWKLILMVKKEFWKHIRFKPGSGLGGSFGGGGFSSGGV